ncbi:MAG: hypothetical protein M3256_21065 [Actinomycetota bacterium]|nr:hypothetical protein [Actinomycetota bacterium]
MAAATDASGALLTAAFSVATAYGAVIALVAPKDKQAPVLVALPFVGIAVAVVAAMIGRTTGVSLVATNDVGVIRNDVTSAVGRKRQMANIAIVALAAALIVAGYVLGATYRSTPATAASNSNVVVTFTPDGKRVFDAACGSDAATVTGKLQTASPLLKDFVTVAPSAPTKCTKVSMPASLIAAVVGE